MANENNAVENALTLRRFTAALTALRAKFDAIVKYPFRNGTKIWVEMDNAGVPSLYISAADGTVYSAGTLEEVQ